MFSDKQKMVIITGCDSGIGRSLCEIMLDADYSVIATFLEKDPIKDRKNYYSYNLDLQDNEKILEFVSFIKGIYNKNVKLEALVNNAGMVLAAPVEDLDIASYKKVFEVNFFGTVSLTSKLIPFIRKDRGKIIINGSLAGVIALPFFSPYVSSKFALEGFADSLRRELNPFGVRTVILEPGAVATPIWNKSWETIKKDLLDKVSPVYKDIFIQSAENFINVGNHGLSPEKAAAKIFRIILAKRPKPRYIISKNTFLDSLPKFLPTGLLDKIINNMFKIEYKNER